MKQRADWFSWITQFVVGMVVGTGTGIIICMSMMRRGWRDIFIPEDAFIFIAATTLAAAGLAALKGDRLWFRKPSIFLPMGHKHSPFSKALAIVISGTGFLTMIGVPVRAVWRTFAST
jgi:hypothetical protein